MKQETSLINNNRKGYEFFITPPNHQGINISNISCIKMYIDGHEIEKESIWIGKNDIEIPIEHLSIFGQDFWYAREKVKIIVRSCSELNVGRHNVEIKLNIFERDDTSPTRYREVSASQIKSYDVDDYYTD